ncbi:MAG: hypothetical protein ABI297_01220 [Ginsengibacter sp.]
MILLHKSFYTLAICLSVTFLFGCDDATNSQPAATGSETLLPDSAKIPANAEANALPYNLEFVENTYAGKPPLPGLQSYVSAVSDSGEILVIGGRSQGLHTFKSAPDTNFVTESSNNFIYVINPKTGDYWSFNVDSLTPDYSAPLQSTNQQFYHDASTDQCYVIGGYGWNAAKTNMLTFNSIISFKLETLVALIKGRQPAAKILKNMQVSHDDRFAVTGGALFKMNSRFYLIFGQKFTGQYRAFGGTDFEQKYTEEVRSFILKPGTLKILSYGKTTNNEADKPFHRRDGNIINGMDPATGKSRIASFGGIFQNGRIAPYTYPVYIYGPAAPVLDRKVDQKFSQYDCAVISVYDTSNKDSGNAIYHTFFGGIGHYYYFQTDSQKVAYDSVTLEGRNDGFPFVADVSTLKLSANGNWQEYIHTSPIPGNRLLGASSNFMLNKQIKEIFENGVINLALIPPGKKIAIGYIYGGIESENPLPLQPNYGTVVSNILFTVYLTRTPTAAIPARYAHESTKQDSKLLRH